MVLVPQFSQYPTPPQLSRDSLSGSRHSGFLDCQVGFESVTWSHVIESIAYVCFEFFQPVIVFGFQAFDDVGIDLVEIRSLCRYAFEVLHHGVADMCDIADAAANGVRVVMKADTHDHFVW